MKKLLSSIYVLLLAVATLTAQDFPKGKLSADHMTETNSDEVTMYHGSCFVELNDSSLVFDLQDLNFRRFDGHQLIEGVAKKEKFEKIIKRAKWRKKMGFVVLVFFDGSTGRAIFDKKGNLEAVVVTSKDGQYMLYLRNKKNNSSKI